MIATGFNRAVPTEAKQDEAAAEIISFDEWSVLQGTGRRDSGFKRGRDDDDLDVPAVLRERQRTGPTDP